MAFLTSKLVRKSGLILVQRYRRLHLQTPVREAAIFWNLRACKIPPNAHIGQSLHNLCSPFIHSNNISIQVTVYEDLFSRLASASELQYLEARNCKLVHIHIGEKDITSKAILTDYIQFVHDVPGPSKVSIVTDDFAIPYATSKMACMDAETTIVCPHKFIPLNAPSARNVESWENISTGPSVPQNQYMYQIVRQPHTTAQSAPFERQRRFIMNLKPLIRELLWERGTWMSVRQFYLQFQLKYKLQLRFQVSRLVHPNERVDELCHFLECHMRHEVYISKSSQIGYNMDGVQIKLIR